MSMPSNWRNRLRPSRPILLSTLGVVTIGALIPLTPLGDLMHFTPLPPALYALIAVLVVVYLGLVEFGKHLFYRALPTGPHGASTPPRTRRHRFNRRTHWFHQGRVRAVVSSPVQRDEATGRTPVVRLEPTT